MIATDIVTDFEEGVSLWHIFAEGGAGLLALCGMIYILRSMVMLKADLNRERDSSATLRQEADEWRTRSKEYFKGLSAMIDSQLAQWNLTPAEREVAFLLLKGLSLNDISSLRGTSERTVRAQSISIYGKAGLKNRSELSAFFLEDLLPADAIVKRQQAYVESEG